MADAPEFPNLLQGYAVRPPWQVAGVDYYVGAPSGPLLDPTLISRAGVSVDTSSRTIFISGNNITLSGYDFGLHNGYQVVITGNNDTVTNSNFALGTNTGADLISVSGSNAVISHDTMQASTDAGTESSLISFTGSGSITLDSNYFHDFPQHILECSQGSGTTFSVSYTNNLIYNGHPQPGPDHLNYLQFGGGHATLVDVEHNTAYQTSDSGGEMWQFYDNFGGSIDNSILAYNTAMAVGGNGSFEQGSQMGFLIHGGFDTTYPSANPGVAHDNYFDPTTSWGPFYGGSMQGWTVTNNYDMVTGKIINANNSEVPTTGPSALTIIGFSPDTGVVGDGITDANKLTLTGTAAANSAVNILDGSTQVGTTTSNASGAWSIPTPTLADGKHSFTATTTAGTSTALVVTIDTHVPAAPVVASFSPDTGGIDTTNQLTLTGTAEANSTVTIFDGSTKLGTAVANANGAWSYPTGIGSNGVHIFTATATDVAGNIGSTSAPLAVTVNAPVTTNLVVNGGFETGNFTGWTIGTYQPDQTIITTNSESGNYAAALGPAGGDGSLSQNIPTTAGQQYTLDFWLANMSTATDDFSIKWNGVTVFSLVNAPAQPYTEHIFTVTGAAGSSTLEFDYRQDPTQWRLDNISVIGVAGSGTPTPPAPPAIASFSPNTSGVDTTNTITLKGTAEANSTVTVYDGKVNLSTTKVDTSGNWSFTETNASNGVHTFTATDTDANGASAASSAFPVTVNVSSPSPHHHHWSGAISTQSGVTSGTPSLTDSTSTAINGPGGASVSTPAVVAQSSPAPSLGDRFATMGALLSQYMTASNGQGASISAPPVVAQSSPAPVTLVSPFHIGHA
jgi:Bacterial Ig-like domain